MKPSWDEAPEEARYLAQDGSGEWFWYAEEPQWYAARNEWFGRPIIAFAGADVAASESLERRP